MILCETVWEGLSARSRSAGRGIRDLVRLAAYLGTNAVSRGRMDLSPLELNQLVNISRHKENMSVLNTPRVKPVKTTDGTRCPLSIS